MVTGAASGIGRATVELLAERGHEVYAAGHNQGALASLASDRIQPFPMEVADSRSWELLAAQIDGSGGGLD